MGRTRVTGRELSHWEEQWVEQSLVKNSETHWEEQWVELRESLVENSGALGGTAGRTESLGGTAGRTQSQWEEQWLELSHWEEQWVELSQWEEQGIAPSKALVSMSEFGELWKQQKSPA